MPKDKSSSGLNDHRIRPIKIGMMNGIGTWTLYEREMMRFMKIFVQTVLAPIVTSLLFLAVFAVAVGERIADSGEVAYVVFLGPGLVMMVAVQNAFANTSSSLVVGKVQGNIVDLLTPPLAPFETMMAMALAGVTRGLIVGIITAIVLAVFGSAGLPVHPFWAFAFLFLGSGIMSLLGIIAGIWSNKFDGLAAVTNFLIQPMVFLSGTFYSINQLPPPFDVVALYNPVFHMIDGYRYAVIGTASFPPIYGSAILLVIMLALGLICWRMIYTGYKLKA